jgi:hypothetical protein
MHCYFFHHPSFKWGEGSFSITSIEVELEFGFFIAIHPLKRNYLNSSADENV